MKPSKPCIKELTPHVKNAFKEREVDIDVKNSERTKMFWEISGRQLPIETQRRIIADFRLPKITSKNLLRSEFLIEKPKAWAKIIESNHASDINNCLNSKYHNKAISLFIEEMGYIFSVYIHQKNNHPTKAELKTTYKKTIKCLSSHLMEIDKHIKTVERKSEWSYIHDLIINSYIEVHKNRGEKSPSSYHAEIFFLLSKKMFSALKIMPPSLAFDGYNANGRIQRSRNNALVALAGSYDNCFGKMPSAAIKGDFYGVAGIFLEFIGEQETDGLELIKNAVIDYKYRKMATLK